MSTTSRFFLSIAALFVMISMTSVSVSAQDDAVGGGGGPAAQAPGRRLPPPPAPTGPVPRRPDGKPDLTGNWDGSAGVLHNSVILEDHPGGFGIQAGKTLIIDPKDGVIPYQPWALAERNRRREDANGYEDQVGHCEFYDIGRVHQFAKEFMFSGNNFVINDTQHITRVIPMDRREHLPENIRLWLGDSIGRWEGDTLVVDTTNMNDKTRMALGGDFHGAEAHIVERFTMVDSNTINWTMTIDNPKVFTRPWTLTSTTPMMRRASANNFDAEDTCHEGNVDLIHLKNVYDQAHGSAGAGVKWPPEYVQPGPGQIR